VKAALRAFGLFWVDFLVGDTPEIFVGTLVVIGGALLLRHQRAAGLVFLVVVTIGLFVLSTLRGRKRTT
jgi:hypothetical protein